MVWSTTDSAPNSPCQIGWPMVERGLEHFESYSTKGTCAIRAIFKRCHFSRFGGVVTVWWQCSAQHSLASSDTAGSGGISGARSYGGGILMTGGRWTIQSTAELHNPQNLIVISQKYEKDCTHSNLFTIWLFECLRMLCSSSSLGNGETFHFFR